MFLSRLAENLMADCEVDMLDVTKCSTTARRVYDYLCAAPDGGSDMRHNNNLADVSPNLDELRAEALSPTACFAAYVHFDHMTNDTSHYFIVLCSGGSVVVLQSAVFEFSIRDWLFPERAREELLQTTRRVIEEAAATEGDQRSAFAAEQAERDRVRGEAILDSIQACRWGAGAVSTAETFACEFVPALASLEGHWKVDDVGARSAAYRRLFACRLQEDVVRSVIRNGFDKPASVKVHIRALREDLISSRLS